MGKKIQNIVTYKKVDELCLLEHNPRVIKKDRMDKLVQSIKDNPDYFEARPIICSDRTGKLVIIAGNQRLRAAKILHLDEVPTVVLHGLSEERERELIIRDNVELGDWDFDILANEWDEELLKLWGGNELVGATGNGLVEKLKMAEHIEKEMYFIKRPFLLIFYDETTKEKLEKILGIEIDNDTYDAENL